MLLPSLRQALAAKLEQELAALTKSQQETQDGMTHAESRAENDKDTRAIESSYLARGLATRVGELKRALATVHAWTLPDLAALDPIRMGSCVQLVDQDRDARSLVWLAPVGAGAVLQVGEQRVMVLSPNAPLGRALLGKTLDDEFETQGPQGPRSWFIEAILRELPDA